MKEKVDDSSSCGTCEKSGLKVKEELSLVEEAQFE